MGIKIKKPSQVGPAPELGLHGGRHDPGKHRRGRREGLLLGLVDPLLLGAVHGEEELRVTHHQAG